MSRDGARLTDDKILVTPRPDPKVNRSEQFGPMMLSTDGKLLWFQPRPDKVHDLKVIDVGGRPDPCLLATAWVERRLLPAARRALPPNRPRANGPRVWHQPA